MSYDPIRILIVDDNEGDYVLVRELCRDIQDIQFNLEWVSTLEEALSTCNKERFDICLLDYHLGAYTGLDVMREMIARGIDTPFIILTGLENRDVDLQAMEVGATDYLVKGNLNPDTLERSIRYAIARDQVEKELQKAHSELEQRVVERTAELASMNASLQEEIGERRKAELALKNAHSELEKRVQERTVALSMINELLELEIAERNRTEGVLRESEAKHRALLDAMPDMMFRVRSDGILLDYRTQEGGPFNLKNRKYLARPIAEVLPTDFAHVVLTSIQKALHTGQKQIFELQLPVDGLVRDFEARVVVSGTNETLSIVRDITDRKRVERLKDEFISVVSHELRTPMTSISGSLTMMAAGVAGELPPQAKAMIDIAHRNSERLVRLINDLLDLQKIESGKLTVDLQPVEMQSLVQQVIEANYAYGKRYGISFELDDGDAAWVSGDPDRLTQVVTNLLSNAAKFSPEGGVVNVGISKGRHAIRIAVQDQGTGIPEADQETIFQKFMQANSTTARQKEGTGLGLSICKAIVERHGGDIGFETELGIGSTFYFTIPAWREETSEVASPSVGTMKLVSGSRILVCEDDPDVAYLLETLLQQEGYYTDRAQSATEARKFLSHRTYDAITLDIMLPDANGVELIREWRAENHTRHLPIVVVSAVAEEVRSQLNGGAIGIVDWLEKPINAARLRHAVRQATLKSGERKAAILHVEDDPDIGLLVSTILKQVADIDLASSLDDARHKLTACAYDLVLLDLNLPDGRGLELLPLLSDLAAAPIPVVIFSSEEVDQTLAGEVHEVLLKARTTNRELMQVIHSALGIPTEIVV